MKRISILLIALLAFVVAACSSGEASPSATSSEPAATEEATPEPTESESEEPSGAPESAVAIPSFDTDADPELAARFPDTVGGEPLEIQSFGGDLFAAGAGSDPTFDAFLDSVGADLDDVTVAFGGSASAGAALSVGAFRIEGANEDDLEREFIAASEEAGDVSDLSQASVGGKDVWTAADPSGETGTSVCLYTKDDTVYFLTGTEEQVSEILAALP